MMNNIELKTALDSIVNQDAECQAIVYLTKVLNQKSLERLELLKEARSGLKAIQKINAGANTGIAALCEEVLND